MNIVGLLAAGAYALVHLGYSGWRKEGIAQWEMIQEIAKAKTEGQAKEGSDCTTSLITLRRQENIKKSMHIEDIAEFLVLLCASEWADEDAPGPWLVQPLHREVVPPQFTERNEFMAEATFLAYFAVDYGTTAVLGQFNTKRSAVLDAVYIKFMLTFAKDHPNLDLELSNILNERLTMYSGAYHFHRAKDMWDRVCMIAGTFCKLNEGRTQDPDLIVKAGVHFAAIVDSVRKFFDSVNLVY
ncbi:MAG: hypothetical protein ABIF19_16170 [Planctomycetota bacterium]